MKQSKWKNVVVIDAVKPAVSEEEIARRAYERWMARGRPMTDGREDWFAAKAELERELETKDSGKRRPGRSTKKSQQSRGHLVHASPHAAWLPRALRAS